MPQPGPGTDSPCKPWPRSLDLTRVGAGAMENVCRWCGDFPSGSVPGHLEPAMHTACAAAVAAEHRVQTSGPCRAPCYERDHVPYRRRRPAQRQRGRGPPSLRCSSPSRLRARRSRAHRSRRRRASPCRGTPGRSHRRGTAKQAGRVRRRRGQPDLGTDHRKLGNVWRTAESNYGSSRP